jgi:hypothetical protein
MNAAALGGGLPVQTTLREFGQGPVGIVFLLERLVQQSFSLFHAKLVGPGDERSVPSDLVMLNGLSVGDHAGIEHIGIGGSLHVLLTLFKDAPDGKTGLAHGLSGAQRKQPPEALYLPFGLLKLVLEDLPQLCRLGLPGHLRQGLLVHVLEQVDQKGPPTISFWP